jgi:hypothetical protein
VLPWSGPRHLKKIDRRAQGPLSGLCSSWVPTGPVPVEKSCLWLWLKNDHRVPCAPGGRPALDFFFREFMSTDAGVSRYGSEIKKFQVQTSRNLGPGPACSLSERSRVPKRFQFLGARRQQDRARHHHRGLAARPVDHVHSVGRARLDLVATLLTRQTPWPRQLVHVSVKEAR